MKGAVLPKLSTVLDDPHTQWLPMKVCWYDGRERMLEVVSGTGVWYRASSAVLPPRWVLTRDPSGNYPPKAYFTPDPEEEAVEAIEVVHSFIRRWTIEVTIEESRAHMGVETTTAMVRSGDRAKHTKTVGFVQPGSGDRTGATSIGRHTCATNSVVSKNRGHLLGRAG